MSMKPNPMFEHFDDRPRSRPSLAQMAGAALCGGGLICVLYALAWVWIKISQ